MVRKAWVEDRLFMDEAEGFLLSHALIEAPRTWPPLPPEQPNQSTRLQNKAKKMDWDDQMRTQADDDLILHSHKPQGSHGGYEGIEKNGESSGNGVNGDSGSEGDVNKERCVICLMALRDRTIVGVCGHEFCFECIGVWANQSRRCPLCSADMAPFLLHDLDNEVPTKFYLPPLPSRQALSIDLPGPSRRIMERRAELADKTEPDELDLQIDRRREIYQHELYCKHVGSNPKTQYRPNPTPHEIANSPLLIQRASAFLRRELRIWTSVDVEFLTIHILSLLKAVDIRSDIAIRLLAEYLDPPVPHDINTNTTRNNFRSNSISGGVFGRASNGNASNGGIGPDGGYGQQQNQYQHQAHATVNAWFKDGAEHFAHELYCWLRSPYRELRQWDLVAQYDPLPSEKPTTEDIEGDVDEGVNLHRSSRSLSPSSSRSPSPSGSRAGSRLPLSPAVRSPLRSLSPHGRPRSQSPPVRIPRDPTRRDTFIPARQLDEKRWNEYDSWLDPDYAAWLESERQRAAERLERRKAKWEARDMRKRESALRAWEARQEEMKPAVELLPSPGSGRLGADLAESPEPIDSKDDDGARGVEGGSNVGLSIKGAAVSSTTQNRRISLLERLAKAKAELSNLPFLPENPAEFTAEDLLGQSPPSDPSLSISTDRPKARRSSTSLKETIRARLRLRLKLESERANYRHNIAESRAQELRARLLETKLLRQAQETDVVLKKMDRLDRSREIRRRLMVELMINAETEQERRARELKERLGKEKRRKMLREVLLARKRSLGSGQVAAEGIVGTGEQTEVM